MHTFFIHVKTNKKSCVYYFMCRVVCVLFLFLKLSVAPTSKASAPPRLCKSRATDSFSCSRQTIRDSKDKSQAARCGREGADARQEYPTAGSSRHCRQRYVSIIINYLTYFRPAIKKNSIQHTARMVDSLACVK